MHLDQNINMSVDAYTITVFLPHVAGECALGPLVRTFLSKICSASRSASIPDSCVLLLSRSRSLGTYFLQFVWIVWHFHHTLTQTPCKPAKY